MLGRRGGIDPDLQDRFAQSGLVHLLSISGFHVGLIGGWVFLLATAAARCAGSRRSSWRAVIEHRLRRLSRLARAGHPGGGAGRARSRRCRVRQRQVQRRRAARRPPASCVLLVDPWAVLDLGGWLSAAALWGATRFSRWTDARARARASAGARSAPRSAPRLPRRRSPRWRSGTVAPVGIVLNFAAIPIAAVAVPGRAR